MVSLKDRPGLTRKKVTVRRGGKTFQQYRWVKSSEDIKPEKQKNTKIDMNVIIAGKLPILNSMPSNIRISDQEIIKMNKIKEQSKKLEREIAVPIHFKNNKMFLGNVNNIGNGLSVSVPAGTDTYAVYHTHPSLGDILPFDSLSLEDIMLVTTRHNYQRTNIMMAHTVYSNNLWICIPSSETINEIEKGMADIIKTQKFVTKIKSDCENAIMNDDEKSYRRAIKKYCDKFKMKLYGGPPDNLKEYNGDW